MLTKAVREMSKNMEKQREGQNDFDVESAEREERNRITVHVAQATVFQHSEYSLQRVLVIRKLAVLVVGPYQASLRRLAVNHHLFAVDRVPCVQRNWPI